MNKKGYFSLLLFVLFISINTIVSQTYNVDSLIIQIDSQVGEEKVESYIKISKNYSHKNITKSIEYSLKAIDEAEILKDDALLFKSNLNTAQIYLKGHSFDKMQKYLNKAMDIAIFNNNDYWLAQSLLLEANYSVRTCKCEQADKQLNSLLRIIKSAGKQKDINNAYILKSTIEENRGNISLAEQTIKKAIKYTPIEDTNEILLYKKQLAEFYYRRANNVKALSILVEIQKLEEEYEYTFDLANTLVLEVKNYLKIQELTLARKTLERSFLSSMSSDNSFAKGLSKKYLGHLSVYNKHYLDATNKFNEAIKEFALIEQTIETGKVYNNLGFVEFRKNNPKKALEYYHKALKIYEKYPNKYSIANTNKNIANIYYQHEKYDSSIFYLEKAIIISKQCEFNEILTKSYEIFTSIYTDKKEYKKAYDYQSKQIKIQKNYITRNIVKTFLSEQNKYQIFKIDQQRKYKDTTSNIKKIESKSNTLIIYLKIILLVVFVCIVILLVLYLNIIKRKNNIFFKKQKTVDSKISKKKDEIILSYNVLNKLPEGVIVINTKGSVTYKNIAAVRLLKGIKSNSIISDIIPDLNKNKLERIYNSLKNSNTNKIKILESEIKVADNKILPIEISLELYEYKQSEVFIIFIKDISYRRNSEKKLKEANAKSELSDKYKTHFISNVSNEIRTSLNNILSLLKKVKQNDDTKNDLKRIERKIHRLIDIASSTLDLSLLESDNIKIDIKKTDLSPILKNLKYDYENQISEKDGNITFNTNFEFSSSHLFIDIDPDKFYQIMNILLSNAVKNTEQGEIEFGYTKKGKNIIFYIKDTGKGISDITKKSVFLTFGQIDNNKIMTFSDMSLDLPICAKLVEKIGGKIWMKSLEHKGSIFYIELPNIEIVPQKNPEKNLNKERALKSSRIVLYDESKTSSIFVKAILKKRFSNIVSSALLGDISTILNNEEKIDYAIVNLDNIESNVNWFLREIAKKHPESEIIGIGNNNFNSEVIHHHLKVPISNEDFFSILK